MSFKTFPKNKDLTVLYIFFLSIVSIFIVLGILSSTGQRVGELGLRISCTSNLKQIGLSLKQYAMDYEGYFPDKDGWSGLDKLRKIGYLTDYGVYRCPSTSVRKDNSGPLCKENVSYVYLGGFNDTEEVNIPLALDIPSNHTGHYEEPSNMNYYINILFLDGRVKNYKIKVKNCREVIEELNSMFDYPQKRLKLLYKKADIADRLYNLK